MITVEKTELTTDKYIIIDEKQNLVMEIETGKQYIVIPHDFPETTATLFEPAEWWDKEQQLLKNIENDERIKEFRKKIAGE